MKFNKYLICALFLVLICCIGAASAAEADDVVAANDTIDEAVSEAVDVSDEIDEEPLGVSEEPVLSDGEDNSSSEKVIYVGHNNKTDDGNGSKENPFKSLDMACSNLSGDEKNVTINIIEGNYNFNGDLNFNVDNIVINGIGDVVIFSKDATDSQSITLLSPSATMNYINITFNYNNYTQRPSAKFYPIVGAPTNLAIFENCTFILNSKSSFFKTGQSTSYIFKNCIFIGEGYNKILISGSSGTAGVGTKSQNYSFDYCTFYFPDSNKALLSGFRFNENNSLIQNVMFNNCWFGKNDPTSFITVSTYLSNGKTGPITELPVTKYAQFNVSQKYLGNNQYEIIGKLTWNGTDNQEGMDNFKPMTVALSSNTGNIPANVTLVNGTFKAIYTSISSNHKVIATLDVEEIELEFNTVNISAEASFIKYGEDQNITVNFSQPITANVTINVSNGNYNKTEKVEVIGKDSITYTIPDILKEGIYNVEISLAENNLFGSNTTTFTVLKVSEYTFNIDIQDNGDIKASDDVTITVELPSDVSGNVTVKVNDNPEITKEATPNTVITINNLVGGNNNITISYNGNDKYAAKTSEPQVITAQKASVPGGENILNVTAPANSATPTFTINLPNATGNLTVIVDGKDKYTKALENGSATITVPELSAGKHDITVTYSGDAKYESISKNTTVNVPAKTTPSKTPVVKKAATKITAKKKTFKAKTKVKKYTITLKSGKKPVKKVQVTIKIGKKTFKAKTNAKGKATFKIKKLTKKGKYTAVIKFKGNKNYKATTKKVKITIKK